MEAREISAKTVEQAIEQGLKELGLQDRSQAEIVVLEEKTGLFKKAKISIKKILSDGEKALEFVEQLLEKMNFSAVVELKENEEELELVVSSAESNVIIGKRGETLDALQYMVSMYVNADRAEFRRVIVDCEGYRAKRIEILKNLADKLAAKAVENGRKVKLEPMNPYERRIIHAQLQSNDQVRTESFGEEPNRYVVIFAKIRKPYDKGARPFNRGGARGDFNRDRNGDRPPHRDGGFNRDRNGDSGFNRDRNGDRPPRRDGGFNRDRDRNPAPRNKEITFGTFLGNTKDNKEE